MSITSAAIPGQAGARTHEPGTARSWLFPPAWPLAWLLYGFPVFWALGLPNFAVTLMAVPMVVHLYRRRPLRLPRGFGFWVLFLVWSLVGVLLLGVNPPGTVAEPASSRLLGYLMREVSYLSVTVVLLYVGNLTHRELPTRRIAHMLGWLFMVSVVGGVSGLLFPYFEFTSPFEMLLPSGIRSNGYVQQLTHPTLAQVQELIGGETPRPAAPFGYTNTWGFHMTILGVWFATRWFVGARLRQRLVAIPFLLAGPVALLLSLNRSAWLGAVLAALLVALRLARYGRFLPLVGTMLAGALVAMVVVASPLQAVIQARLEDGKSNDIRAFTTERALELSLQSPVVGYGSTRNAMGSASSIAVGKSDQCPQCGNVSIGINGYLYMLLMTTGWVGAALFFGLWVTQLIRSRGDPSPWVTAAVVSLLLTMFYGLFYDVSTWMMVPMICAGVLWREDLRRNGELA